MSTTPNQKDLLAKKTDLEGILKPDANDILHLPDITITLAENGQFYLAGISKKLLTLIGNTSGNAVTLDGDAGLTFTTSGGSSTITGITSSSGNSTSLAASQSMVSAKQDTLTAGTNITISNNTISATDTNTLSDLTDTAISSLADGQVLKYNATSGKWVNGTGGGGAEVILGTTAPTAAQGSNGNLYIQYDDTNNNTVTHEYVKISGAWEEIAIGGGGGSTTTVSVTPKVLTGINIADITVGNGNTTDIYDYAYFDGSGYYETPFIVDTDHEYEITFEANYDTTMAVIGTYAGANYFHLTIYSNYWYVGTNSGEVHPSAYTTGKHTFKTDSSHTYLDDTQFTSYTPAVVNNYITIGARQNTYLYKGKFYEFKIKSISTGNVLYDLVPGMRGTTKGLYDLVSDTFVECSFITNMGTKTGTSGGVTTQLYAPSIEANPSGTATATLNKVEINNVIYDLPSGGGGGGGSSVTPNPTDPATDALTSIEIDGTVYSVGGGDASAEEITLNDYNALTTEEKNDGTIRFIPKSNIGYGLDIDFTNSTAYKESGMSNTTVNNNSVQIVWDITNIYCGLTIYPTVKVDVTNYDYISYDFTSTNSYDSLHPGSENPVRDLGIGLKSTAPSAMTLAPNIDYTVWNRYEVTDVGTTFTDERIDVSNLTGEYYLIIACAGWNATVSNIVIGTEGGNPSQIKYMDKTYGIGEDGEGYTEEVIYSATPSTAAPSTLTLTKPYTDFDMLLFNLYRSADGVMNKYDRIVLTSKLSLNDRIQLITYNEWASYDITTTTSFTLINENRMYIGSVVGLKFGEGSGDGGSSEVTYSTTEHKVGTWIDGSDVYEKTIVLRENGTDNYTYSNSVFSQSLPANINWINIESFYAKRGSGGWVDCMNNQQETILVPNPTTQGIYFYSQMSHTDIIVTIRYTKTT